MKSILVVEDDPGLRTVVRMILEDRGYDIAEARHGAEALARMRDRRPDLVLADMRMPVMDGRQMVAGMREEHGLDSIPVVLITGYAQDEGGHGADAVILKPFDATELLQTVRELTE